MNGVSLRDASKGSVAVDLVADELVSDGTGLRGDLGVSSALVGTAGPKPTGLITHGLKTERPTRFLGGIVVRQKNELEPIGYGT